MKDEGAPKDSRQFVLLRRGRGHEGTNSDDAPMVRCFSDISPPALCLLRSEFRRLAALFFVAFFPI